MAHHIIYIPGIGDNKSRVEGLVIAFWRLFGVRGHCCPMPWTASDFQTQLDKVLDLIDALTTQGHTVSLVGASAGASGVLHAYLNHRDAISGLVYICAKINRPETVSDRTNNQNPAFKQSLAQLQPLLSQLTDEDKRKMRSFYSLRDKTVSYEDTVIPGVAERRLPPLSHGLAIVYTISFGAPRLLGFLKQLAKQQL